ncbi:MAG: sigma-54-dependent transcriptional regulator [Thermodesulfobacteriota bacterium]
MLSASILVVDDDPNSLFGICQILKDEGYQVVPAGNGKEALEKLKTNGINMVITDERMPDLTGMDLLTEIKRMDPKIPVILITAYGSVSMAVDALKKGAFYFFEKPIFNNLEQFFAIIRQALKAQEMEREIDHLRREVSEKYSFPNIIGNHPKMQEIFELVGKVARTDQTILIQGESGTGKDLIAKTIHYNSHRKDKPLVTVHCGALTDTLLTSELFGHTKGAFTGAIKDKIGRFQMADGGTLVLDEIGEVPLHLQKTLLRVIEYKEFERVGDSRPIKVDVRIISSTNRNLKEEVAKGNFREDLYYRLSIVPITLPPLRERVSDIPLLVNHFLRQFQGEKRTIRIDPEVMDYLKKCQWPGNIRELANVIQQMIVLCSSDTITMNDLPPLFVCTEDEPTVKRTGSVSLMRMISDLERRWILSKLKESEWNQEKTAKLLGITRKMLMNRMRKYNIRTPKNKMSMP